MSVQISGDMPKKAGLEVQTFMHGFSVIAGTQKYFFPYRSIIYFNIGKKDDESYVLTLKVEGGATINLGSAAPLDEEFAQICRHYN